MKLHLAVLLVIASTATAHAEMGLELDLDSLALRSTDVIVADKVGKTRVRIVETWLGNLVAGDTIDVGSITERADRVSTKRIVLFLVQRNHRWRGAAHDTVAARTALRASIVWLDDKTSFATGGDPFGDGAIRDLGQTQAQLRVLVDEYKTLRAELVATDALPSDKRIVALQKFLPHKRRNIAATAVTKLGTVGATAIDPIHKIIRDDTLADLHDTAIFALAIAAGRDAPTQLAAVLDEETAFWRGQRQALTDLVKRSRDGGWANVIPSTPNDTALLAKLHVHYTVVSVALQTLARTGGGRSQPAVRTLCTLWPRLPPIGFDTIVDATGDHQVPSSQVADACNAALRR